MIHTTIKNTGTSTNSKSGIINFLSMFIIVMLTGLVGTIHAMGKSSGTASESTGGIMGFLPMLVVMFVVMYFFIIRPQQKKQKDATNMLNSIKKGSKVSTVGGIQGTVVGVNENFVTLKIAENTKVEFKKSAINNVIDAEGNKK